MKATSINRVLQPLGLQLSRFAAMPLRQRREYRRQLKGIENHPGQFIVVKEPRFEGGDHPTSEIDFQCAFAARALAGRASGEILDIGSFRLFLLGVLAHRRVTTIDVRPRRPDLANEVVITADARVLPLEPASVDTVVSLYALASFGLGRYGDQLDLTADSLAFCEMVRVLRPGGHLIFTTTVTRGHPVLAFNSHRIYSLDMIHQMCAGLSRVEEQFYNRDTRATCSYDDIRTVPGQFDVYAGWWRKGDGYV